MRRQRWAAMGFVVAMLGCNADGLPLTDDDRSAVVDLAPTADFAHPLVCDEVKGFLMSVVWGRGPNDVFALRGDVVHTKDGFATWESLGVDLGTNAEYSMWGDDFGDLFVMTELMNFHSADNGATWQKQRQWANQLGWNQDIWGSGRDFYMAAVASDKTPVQAVIVHSSNGGATWTPQPISDTDGASAIWGSGPLDIYAVGGAGDAVSGHGTIFHSADRGASWQVVASGIGNMLDAIWGSSADDLYATGLNATVLHSTDRGKTWQSLPMDKYLTLDPFVVGVWGSGPEDVYVSASPYKGGHGVLLRSTDRGANWSTVCTKDIGLLHLWGSGSGDLYVTAEGGRLFHVH